MSRNPTLAATLFRSPTFQIGCLYHDFGAYLLIFVVTFQGSPAEIQLIAYIKTTSLKCALHRGYNRGNLQVGEIEALRLTMAPPNH